jgi:hypothetical protein
MIKLSNWKFSIVSILLVSLGVFVSAFAFRQIEFIYVGWFLFGMAFICGRKAYYYKITNNSGKWAKRLAIVACILSIYFAIGITFMAHEVNLVNSAGCRGNLYVLTDEIMRYCDKHNGNFPAPSKWCDLLKMEMTKKNKDIKTILLCPSVTHKSCDYAFNKTLIGLKRADIPPDTVLLFESTHGWNQHGGPKLIDSTRHKHLFSRRHGYLICAGGKIKPITNKTIKEVRWDPRDDNSFSQSGVK